MIRAAIVSILGLGIVWAATTADLRGWLGTRPSLVRNVPRSIRDNPGAYRSMYAGAPRYFGGK